MWKGTALTLKASPTTTSSMPTMKTPIFPLDAASAPFASATTPLRMPSRSVCPVAP